MLALLVKHQIMKMQLSHNQPHKVNFQAREQYFQRDANYDCRGSIWEPTLQMSTYTDINHVSHHSALACNTSH